MVGGDDAGHVQWTTVGGVQQPGNLRAHGNAVVDYGNAGAGNRDLVEIRNEVVRKVDEH